MNNEGCLSDPEGVFFFFWTTETLRLSAKQACFLPPKPNKCVEFTLTTECMTSIFRKYSESLTGALWVAPSFIFWWTDSDNGLMNLWHVSKTHPKNTPTVLFYAESCHHWNHFLRWCWSLRRIMYYECPSWGCLQFHYYSLFEAFFVGFVGLLRHENMTENCGPCESSQISNLRAMISKQNVPSALPCCPVLPRERLRVQNSTQTLFMEKAKMLMSRTGYVSQNILTSTWNERKGKVIYFIFFLSNSFLSRSYFNRSSIQNQEHTIKAFMLFMSPTKGNRWLLEYHPKLLLAWHILQPSSNDTMLPVIYTTSLTLSPQFSKFGSLIGKFLGPDPGPEPKMITIH